jgi:hypothetical protein
MKGQETQNVYKHKRLNQMNDPAFLFFIGSFDRCVERTSQL